MRESRFIVSGLIGRSTVAREEHIRRSPRERAMKLTHACEATDICPRHLFKDAINPGANRSQSCCDIGLNNHGDFRHSVPRTFWLVWCMNHKSIARSRSNAHPGNTGCRPPEPRPATTKPPRSGCKQKISSHLPFFDGSPRFDEIFYNRICPVRSIASVGACVGLTPYIGNKASSPARRSGLRAQGFEESVEDG